MTHRFTGPAAGIVIILLIILAAFIFPALISQTDETQTQSIRQDVNTSETLIRSLNTEITNSYTNDSIQLTIEYAGDSYDSDSVIIDPSSQETLTVNSEPINATNQAEIVDNETYFVQYEYDTYIDYPGPIQFILSNIVLILLAIVVLLLLAYAFINLEVS